MDTNETITHSEGWNSTSFWWQELTRTRVSSLMEKNFMAVNLFAFDTVWVRVYPERWGMVTSLRFGDTEILYQGMLDETLFDTTKTVKWGVPILFPNAGPLTEDQKNNSGYTLPQHGFARTNPWKMETAVMENQLLQSLNSTDVSDNFWYPFRWSILNALSAESKNSFLFEYFILNRWEQPLPIALGLHPYFSVPMWDKSLIEWNFRWGEQIRDELEKWSNGGTTKIDIPKDGKLHIVIPWIGKLDISVSPDFQRLWIWSLPGKDFVCIEPVMSDAGGIVENPVVIPPNSDHTSFMRIALLGEDA